jgi:hypothetical protein
MTLLLAVAVRHSVIGCFLAWLSTNVHYCCSTAAEQLLHSVLLCLRPALLSVMFKAVTIARGNTFRHRFKMTMLETFTWQQFCFNTCMRWSVVLMGNLG